MWLLKRIILLGAQHFVELLARSEARGDDLRVSFGGNLSRGTACKRVDRGGCTHVDCGLVP
jgi:hypothetical protein